MSRYAHQCRSGDLPLLTVVVEVAASGLTRMLSPDDGSLLWNAAAGTRAALALPPGDS